MTAWEETGSCGELRPREWRGGVARTDCLMRSFCRARLNVRRLASTIPKAPPNRLSHLGSVRKMLDARIH